MTETQLKVKVLKHIKRKYPNAWCYKTSDKFRSGVPDLLVLYKGKLLAMELKSAKGKTSKLQDWTLAQILIAGGKIGVCSTIDAVDRVFEAAGFKK